MGIDTPEEKNLQVKQMDNNYFATLDDDVENDEGVGQPPSPSGQSPSAQRRSGILQRLPARLSPFFTPTEAPARGPQAGPGRALRPHPFQPDLVVTTIGQLQQSRMSVAFGIVLCELAAFTLALSMNVQQYALTSYVPAVRSNCCSKERVWLCGLALYVLAQVFFVGGKCHVSQSITLPEMGP